MRRRLTDLIRIGILCSITSMIALAGNPYTAGAQTFNCEVSVNDRQISGSSYDYVRELGPALERYINENRWADDRFEPHERIRCRVQVVLTDVDSRFNYDAEVVFQLRRPVYNTMQETVTAVLSDSEWSFHYPRGRSLIRDDMQYDDLTSVIDFYLYILLGLDYDSFGELAGTSHYNRALEIFEIAQVSGGSAWTRGFGSQRNRYGLINDLTHPLYEPFRRAFYQYHRLGLDPFTMDPEQSREEVLEAVRILGEGRYQASNNYLYDIFFDSKYTELVSIFRDAPMARRQEAHDLLREVDPGHSSEYGRLLEQGGSLHD